MIWKPHTLAALIGLLTLSGCRHDVSGGGAVRYEFGREEGYYCYAPSVIEDVDGVRYAFVCRNMNAGEVVDHIFLYTGTPSGDSTVWDEGACVLSPSAEGWDRCHVCDPDVREFPLTYRGEQYRWIMTYLGVDRWDCLHNQIGLAFAKEIGGPYVKYDRNPLIVSADTTTWGVGQSTSIVADPSTIRIFYACRGDRLGTRLIRLNPVETLEIGPEELVPGLPPNSYPATSGQYLYAVSETRSGALREVPTWVGDICRVQRMPLPHGITRLMPKDPAPHWTVLGEIVPARSGSPRNHNPGLLTDTRGYVADGQPLTIYFTPADTGSNWLWSYEIRSMRISGRSRQK